MKRFLTASFLSISLLCFANMASPYRDGTILSSAIASKDIDIVSETIHITVGEDFNSALFSVGYTIKTETGGRQIPLLFQAVKYNGDFNVWVDDQVVTVSPIPAAYQQIPNEPFRKFPDTLVHWTKHGTGVSISDDLKYFETTLTKGEHKIRIDYLADASLDLREWVRHYTFDYALSPAKYWKSFGTLEITLDARKIKSTITTNLGNPVSGKTDSVAVWIFTKLPGDSFEIKIVPEVNALAKILLRVDVEGLSLFLALLLTLLHLIFMRQFRRRHPPEKYSWVVMVGGILVPFLILVFSLYAFDLIDAAIGEVASRYHGYTFLVFFFYPILVPLYWLSMWLVDKFFKKKWAQA